MHILLYFLVVVLQQATSQFSKHLDLQKVGEIVFNNEKYNVLKPTTHMVTDYFKSYMLGQVRRNPNERVFIDDNGFRHQWAGLDIKVASLRKTDISAKNLKVNEEVNDFREFNKESDELTIEHNIVTKDRTKSDSNSTKKKLKQPKRKKKAVKNKEEGLRQGNTDKTIATTSFFCPFFGVITMKSHLN